jgi:selenide,water dikinase
VLNRGAKPGDALVLTKAIGTGIVANAIKKELAPDEATAEALTSMIRLNDAASHAMRTAGATACTDITGFGLLGHLHNVVEASGVSADLHAMAVPVLGGARALAEADHFPGGTRRNLEAALAYTSFDPGVDARTRLILADAQTSGGLLITVPPSRLARLQSALREAGDFAARIGEVHESRPDDPGRIFVR